MVSPLLTLGCYDKLSVKTDPKGTAGGGGDSSEEMSLRFLFWQFKAKYRLTTGWMIQELKIL